MSQQIYDIEGLFKKAYKEHRMLPSAKVLRKLRFKLWLQDFFGFRLKKFNVFYATGMVVVTSVIAINVKSTGSSEAKIEEEQTQVIVKSNTTTNASENISENNIPLTIEAEPEQTLDELEVVADYIPSSEIGCVPMLVQFKNKSLNGTEYLWNFGDGNISTEKNPEYEFEKAGTYVVSLTVQSEHGSNTTTQEIIVNERPEANFSIDIDNSRLASRTIHFKNNSKNSVDYQWQFGDANTSTATSPEHTYNSYAVYKVKLIASNQAGCADTAVISNKFLEENYQLVFPLSFKPNAVNNGNNGYYEQTGEAGSVFYPENLGAKRYELTIWAPNGMKIFNTKDIHQGWNGYIRGRIAPPGLYRYEAKGIYPNGEKFAIKNNFKVLKNNDFDNYGY